jgi:hypothetical protein
MHQLMMVTAIVRHESDRHWAERRIRGELARCGIY